jgi:SAM-dependent methyltransferase
MRREHDNEETMNENLTESLCPTCGIGRLSVFFRLHQVPTSSCILLDSVEAARSWPTGEIALAFCDHCGFVSNVAFEERLTEYSERYEETQGFSPTFRQFHRELAGVMIKRYGLYNKRIVEIGCGKGEFLHLLCELGDNDGLGFDPSYVATRDQPVTGKRVEFVADYFTEHYTVDNADFIACKMTLEHIPDTGAFVQRIRRVVRGTDATVIFIQVPEATRIFRDCAFEDIYYEHCSYFSPLSLAILMERSGFKVLGTGTSYGKQYLTVEAVYGTPCSANGGTDVNNQPDLERTLGYIHRFSVKVTEKMTQWRNELQERVADGQRVVIWGSGSKGVSFLSTVGLGDLIQYAVDINPHRQGYFLPGGGQRILASDEL